ncbi:hypothetical protein [Sodalis-like endosymbiont of Proechinophthirus fluctus]|uniref:hypothetical protein n=1 Tax=Sodalis-like endosymbiont of Proechinophthirus fluctus TaxID=1462730 RepID=UPI0016500838|nr:hypothetical protein [Sodalis-like endosymbiont of Proechinophthirus fluctus]
MTETDYSYVMTVFAFCYALSMVSPENSPICGSVSRWAYNVLVWSLAYCGHAFIRNMLGFCVMLAFLGLAENGTFPYAVKVVSE